MLSTTVASRTPVEWSEEITMEIKLKLRPFQVANYVSVESLPGLKQDGIVEAPTFHVRDLDVDALSELCDRFRADVFANAGKADPKK